jgi:reverse gyrase
LRIEAYFEQIREAIETCPVIQAFNVTYDKRGTYEGFIRGEIYFIDGSILHLREFVDAEDIPERLTYVYQYMTPSQQLVFRYDNTGHHRKLNLSTYPHHKHHDAEDNVVISSAPDLPQILSEIEDLVELST